MTLDRVDRLDEFASIVSHDLRNPLSVAIGQLELAQVADEPAPDRIQKARTALEQMETLIEDLLTCARDGRQIGERTPTALDRIAWTAWDGVTTAGATLTIETDRTVQADPTRLQQVFENLFRNSIEHGGPDVAVTAGACPDDFYVADDGPGLPDETRETIFDGESELVLAIVRAIVEAHGWSVRATDSETGGARIEVVGTSE